MSQDKWNTLLIDLVFGSTWPCCRISKEPQIYHFLTDSNQLHPANHGLSRVEVRHYQIVLFKYRQGHFHLVPAESRVFPLSKLYNMKHARHSLTFLDFKFFVIVLHELFVCWGASNCCFGTLGIKSTCNPCLLVTTIFGSLNPINSMPTKPLLADFY